jgi:hypothetical protein
MSEKQDADPIVYRYQADAGFFHGVPRRDLTARDVARLSPERRKDVAAGTVYRAVAGKAAQAAIKAADADAATPTPKAASKE